MTDETRGPVEVPPDKTTPVAPPLGDRAPGPATRPARRRHSVAGGRIAAAGVGIAAMVGLVANMEVTDGNAKSATPATSSALSSERTAKGVRHGASVAPGQLAFAKVKRPIVLTPHAVVHTVGAPSSGGYSGGSSYVASAPAAVPVASTGGS